MAMRRGTNEKLLKVREFIASGLTAAEACKKAGVGSSQYYKYRKPEGLPELPVVVAKRTYKKKPPQVFDIPVATKSDKAVVIVTTMDNLKDMLGSLL